LVRATNPDVDLHLTRDALGRITSETTNGHTLTNDVDALGRRTARTTPSAVTSDWVYDSAGRPVTLTSGGHTLDFAWDAVGNPVTRRFGATTLHQAFDPLGRLLTQTLAPAPPAREVPAGRHAATPLVTEPMWHREHAYDLAGHLSGIDDGHTGNRAFTVDAVGRVTTVTGPSGPETYAYDRAGNVVDATWPAPEAAAGGDVDPGARGPRDYAGTLIRGAGGYAYTHDRAGRLVRRRHRTLSGKVRVWSYTWDAADRLTAVTTADGSTWRYTYDPLGRRHTKQRLNADGLTVAEQTRFTWDGPTLAEQVHSPSGAVTTWDYQPATFIPVAQQTSITTGDTTQVAGHASGAAAGAGAGGDGDREPVAGQRRDQDWYDRQFHAIVTDLVGSPAALVTPDGHLTREPDRSLWGASIGEDHRERSDLACPLRFPGQYYDLETGLHYNLFRYFDPHIARYTSPDPLGLLGGPNPHTYVPNPLESIDPLGLTTYDVRLSGRREAFNAALDRAGVPRSQQPARQWVVGDDVLRRDMTNYHFDPNPTGHGRYYQYDTPQGTRLVVEHTSDPTKAPHFHAGAPKPLMPSNADMRGQRYAQVGEKHHFFYPEVGL
jgi:RHS repeat-associated protein